MASVLLVAIVKYSLLALLWLFVFAAVRTISADLFGSGRGARAPQPAAARTSGGGRGKRSQARRLVVTEGPLAGTSVTLGEEPVTLGRADDSTLVLTDDYASSRHARLVPTESSWMIEDLGSTNGTYLGKTKVDRPTPVPLGQPIRIGKTAMELRK